MSNNQSNPDSTVRRRYMQPIDSQQELYEETTFSASHDGPADHDGADNEAGHQREKLLLPKLRFKRRSHWANYLWWDDEYKCLAICILSIVILAIVLWYFDGKQAPKLAPGVQLDMIVIALVTASRVAMGSIVEACISQCAWIWIAKTHQLRTQTHARLKDFKLFDEAARGL